MIVSASNNLESQGVLRRALPSCSVGANTKHIVARITMSRRRRQDLWIATRNLKIFVEISLTPNYVIKSDPRWPFYHHIHHRLAVQTTILRIEDYRSEGNETQLLVVRARLACGCESIDGFTREAPNLLKYPYLTRIR